MKENKLYIAVFHYFATGEGWHLYIRLTEEKNKESAKNKFIKIAKQKWHSTEDFVARFTHVYSLEEFDVSKYYKIQDLLKSVLDIAKNGGMIDGEFEFYFSYNLS